MTTTEIIAEFTTLVNTDQEYTLSELKSILSDVYKVKTGKKVAAKKTVKKTDGVPSDEEEIPKKRGRPAKAPKLDANGDVKKKREPSAYNIFIKEKYAEYKQTNPEMTTKDIMLKAATEWSAKKETGKADEVIVEEKKVVEKVEEKVVEKVEEKAAEKVEEKVVEKKQKGKKGGKTDDN